MIHRITLLLSPYSRIFRLLLLGLILFSLGRICFLAYNRAALPEHADASHYLRSFLLGIRFDLVVMCYLLAPYLLFLFTEHAVRKPFTAVSAFFKWYFVLVFLLAALICSADIPYYAQFGTHLNRQFSLWMDSPGMVLGLIFSNLSYVLIFISFLIVSMVIWKTVNRIFRKKSITLSFSPLRSIPVFIVLAFLMLAGMRGRIAAKSPIRTGTAFFSEHYFFNQLGLNPCFVLAKSLTDQSREWEFLSGTKTVQLPETFNKKYTFDQAPAKHNVVIVLMESMAMSKMGYYGCQDLTLRFDSLISQGLFFDHFYSAGIHTFNGVFSTLTGFPAVMDVQPLETYDKKAFQGITWWLKQNGYSNYFFTSHDPQFDNMEGFLKFNHFDEVFSEEDHASEKAISTLGVPDHVLFEFAIGKINAHVSEKSGPFLSFILTSSDHTPWAVPDDIPFRPSAAEKSDRSTQYADWAIGNFMENARKQSWFDHTLFIFAADHGINWGHTYAMPLSYHHVPCLFYMPSQIRPDTSSSLGGQIDIFPTLMSFLRIPFTNASMGIDLLHETRPYMYFSADSRIGCIDKEHYYIKLLDENKELLYRYKDLDMHSYLESSENTADSMRRYAEGMIGAAHSIMTGKRY